MSRNSTDKSHALYDIIRSPCKRILDRLNLEFWIPRCGFRIPGTGFRFFFQGFLIFLIVSGILVCYTSVADYWDSGLLELYSAFQEQKRPAFHIPQSTISPISEFGFPYMGEHNRHHKVSLALILTKMQVILSNMTSYRK